MTIDFDKFRLKKISSRQYKYRAYYEEAPYNHICFCGGNISMFTLTYFYKPKKEFSENFSSIEIKIFQSRCLDCGFRAPQSIDYVGDYDSEGNEVDYRDCMKSANKFCIDILKKISCEKEIKGVLQKHFLSEIEKDLKEKWEFLKEKIEVECQRVIDINDGKIAGLYGQVRQAISRKPIETHSIPETRNT